MLMSEVDRGMAAAVVDCLLWAAAALYWPLLAGTSDDGEILGHRLVWAALFMALIVAATGRSRSCRALVRQPRKMALLAGAAVAITANWAGFVWGVNHGRVVEASLGFFLNPLLTVLLGVLVLGERVRPWRWVSISLGGVAVLIVTLDYGALPWFALTLGLSGGCYALFKKKADAGPYESLAVETALVAPFALAYLLCRGGDSTFAVDAPGHALLLAGSGLVTVAPLLFYGYAARRVPLVTLGLIGYLAPVAIFALGILYFGESLEPARWAGFGLIWAALTVFALDTLRPSGRRAPVIAETAEAGLA